MKKRNAKARGLQEGCATIDDLYRYVAARPDGKDLPELESHLANCAHCREELASVLKLLHPDSEGLSEAEPPLSEDEIAQTVAMIRDAARKENRERRRPRWTRWAAAAAAAIALIIAGAGGLQYYYAHKANQYLAQANLALEEVYSARSPSGLRLDLPFRSGATTRAAADNGPLNNAKLLYAKALGNSDALPEAHLGLAAIYLSESQFADAQHEFQRVLDIRGSHFQATLGKGVAAYEEALLAKDPIRRSTLLGSALTDFDAALKQQPKSGEALYNRIWVLFESGRHQEALAEIDKYLSQDNDSLWAGKLRDLRTRIRLTKPDAVGAEMDRAARTHDERAILTVARVLPEKIPPAIRSALKRSLEPDGKPAAIAIPSSADLVWAAETMEAAYSNTTGDHSWKTLLTFYAGLSPPQRNTKKSLDRRLEVCANLLNTHQIDAALRGSESLGREFSLLGDYWQLFNIHFLRGNCFYYQAQFGRAEAEYQEMMRLAEKTGAPECLAKALQSLIAADSALMHPDDALKNITALRNLAETYSLDSWKATAAQTSGGVHRMLDQLDESVQDYSAALSFAYRDHDEDRLESVLEGLFYVMDRQGRSKEAQALCSEAIEAMAAFEKEAGAALKTVVSMKRLNLLCKLGEMALGSGNLNQAESSFKAGLDGPLSKMHELESRMRLGLAQVYLKKQQYADAKSQLDLSRMLAETGGYADLTWKASYFQGKMFRETGDPAAALAVLRQSVDALEHARSEITAVSLRQQFLIRRFAPYRELVSLHHSLHDDQKADELAEHAKSMTLREYLYGPAQGPAGGREHVARTLGALSIDYFFTSNELLAFVSSSDTGRVITLTTSEAEIDREVGEFLNSIKKGDEMTFRALSGRLFDQLVEPILRTAGNGRSESLLIFPDGPLHLLPFGGLVDPQGRFLVENHVISYAPSRTVLAHCLSLGRGSASSRSRDVLLLDGAANLSGAGNELAILAKLYGKQSSFLDASDPGAAARVAVNAEILHFAGHASFVDGKPALLLDGAPHKLVLDSDTIGSWRLRRSRLVTLFGCETGTGPQAEGETPWGLIPAFLNAGAPAVIVSLLPADDAATTNLAARFYELLSSGSTSKAGALQQAQLSLLRSARAAGRLNPASWLPFVLVGDPR